MVGRTEGLSRMSESNDISFGLWSRFALFASSLAPAILILALRSAFIWWLPSVGLWFLLVVAMLFTRLFLRKLRMDRGEKWEVVEATPADEGFEMYALGFLLPAAIMSLQDVSAIVGLSAFLALFGWTWTHSHLGHRNPMLALAGLHVWSVTLRRCGTHVQRPVLLIGGSRLSKHDIVSVTAMDGPVFYQVRPQAVSTAKVTT